MCPVIQFGLDLASLARVILTAHNCDTYTKGCIVLIKNKMDAAYTVLMETINESDTAGLINVDFLWYLTRN